MYDLEFIQSLPGHITLETIIDEFIDKIQVSALFDYEGLST